MNDDRIVRSLEEDFAKIGWGGGTTELKRLSSKRLDESLYSAPPVQFDPIDGPVVTMELLNRIADLDIYSLDEDDCDALLDGLREKELPEGDAELAEAAEAVVKAILESQRKQVVRDSITGKREVRAAEGYRTTDDGKIEKIAAGEKIKQAKKREIYDRKSKAVQARYAKGRGKRLALKRKLRGGPGPKRKRRINADAVTDALAADLYSILGESDNSKFGAYSDTVSRVARIMSLLEYALGDEVGDVLEAAYEKMENSLLTESSEPARAFEPALRVIARCLEQIDEMGNG